jgi:VanZ family protein
VLKVNVQKKAYWQNIPSRYYWLVACFWPLIIFLLSAQPTLTSSQAWMQIFVIRKSAHLLEFALLTFLVWTVLAHLQRREEWFKRISAYHNSLSFILPLLYAISDEAHQYFVPSRKARIGDIIIDTLGILLALGLISLWQKRQVLLSSKQFQLRFQPVSLQHKALAEVANRLSRGEA